MNKYIAPHLSPGLAAAAEESPRKMQNSKVQGRAASGGAPSEKRAGSREAQDFLPRLPEFLPILVLAETKVSRVVSSPVSAQNPGLRRRF